MIARRDHDTCVYHANCPDGFGGAWAAWRALGDRLSFIPGISGTPVQPQDYSGRSVVLVDFCWDAATVAAVAAVARDVTILDHHETAMRAISGLALSNLRTEFDLVHSGAMIAWRYFHGETPPPELLRYVEDYDLYRLSLPQSSDINLALTSLPFDFELWNSLSVGALQQEGAAISRWVDRQVKRIATSSGRTVIDGVDVPCANAPRCFVDRLGHLLADGEPFAAVWAMAHGRVHVSLRSRLDGMAVNTIAEKFGGRGHRHAAVFSLPAAAWPFRASAGEISGPI